MDDSREPDLGRALRKRLSDWVMSRPSASPEYDEAPGIPGRFKIGQRQIINKFAMRLINEDSEKSLLYSKRSFSPIDYDLSICHINFKCRGITRRLMVKPYIWNSL